MKRGVRRLVTGRVAEWDLALFRAVAGSRSRSLDAVFPRLSHAANHSKLWMAVGVLLGLSGGRWARRGALRGLVAVALTSGMVNLPLKLVLRRARPPLDVVPHARRLRRMPTSWSLPSGHSASAAAFATGVGLEVPRLAGPVGALAAAVGFSRIHTGAHYPADVVVGAAIGAGIAVATTGWWPLAPDKLPTTHRRPGSPQPLARGAGLVCCVNPRAGGLWSPAHSGIAQLEVLSDPAGLVQEHLPEASVVDCGDGDLVETLEREAERARALGVVGGDGSANAGAEVAYRWGLPLLVIPAGTHNHFARDLGVRRPSDPLAAVESGETVTVDVAEIAGRPFLNAASLGGYASLVTARERFEDRFGKWPALVWGLLQVLRNQSPIEVEVDGRYRRVWMLFAGNCRYEPEGFAPSWRERLDDGLLDLRFVDADVPWARARLFASVVLGRLGRCRAYEQWTAPSVRIRSLQGPLRLVRDGEAFDGPAEFEITKRDQSLEVYTSATDA